MCTMFGSLDQRVYHRPLEKHSHEMGRDGQQELQQNTSISRVFVLGALVPAMLLATWWVRPPSMTGGVGNPTTAVKEHFHLSHSVTYSCSAHICYRASNPVDDGRGGQSDHSGKRALSLVTVDHALLHFNNYRPLRPCYKVRFFR